MKRYVMINWHLVHTSPLAHTYRCGWRDFFLGNQTYGLARSSWRRHITIEWDGKEQLTVRLGKLWPFKSQWNQRQLKKIVFGLREGGPADQTERQQRDWLWFIQLVGKGNNSSGVLAEFLLAQQSETPSNTRARVPARVQKFLDWLQYCTGQRPHGPVLVTDEASRQSILSHVETSR